MEVETRIIPRGNWHVRTHRITTSRTLPTAFGFCINAGQSWADNMLCFSEDGRQWNGRTMCDEHSISATELYSKWRPMDGVEVETRIIPRGNWHVRTHRITTSRTLHTVEGGFAANPGPGDLNAAGDTFRDEHSAYVHGHTGSSGIVDLGGRRQAELSSIEPNINVIYPRSLAPLLRQTITPGEYVFTAAVLGIVSRDAFNTAWSARPSS